MLQPMTLRSRSAISIDYVHVQTRFVTDHLAKERCKDNLTARHIPPLPLEIRQQIFYLCLQSSFPIKIPTPPRITHDGRPCRQSEPLDLAQPDHIRHIQHMMAGLQAPIPTTPLQMSTTPPPPALLHLAPNGLHVRPRPLPHELPPHLPPHHRKPGDTLRRLHAALSINPKALTTLLQPIRRLVSSLQRTEAQLRDLQKKMLTKALLHPENRYTRAVPCACPIPLACSFRAGDDGFEADAEECDVKLEEIGDGGSLGDDSNGAPGDNAGGLSPRRSKLEKAVWVAGCQMGWWRYLGVQRKEVSEAVKLCEWYEVLIEARVGGDGWGAARDGRCGKDAKKVRKVRFV